MTSCPGSVRTQASAGADAAVALDTQTGVPILGRLRCLALLGLLLASSGCSFISSSGPTRADIENAAGVRMQDVGPESKLAYALVTLNARIAGQMRVPDGDPTFGEDFTSRPPARVDIGAGDVVSVTIFESAAGGLFIPAEGGGRPGNFVQVPQQQVDESGDITIPFGGTLHVAGLTPIEVQKIIEGRIDKRALEPQAVVSLTEHHSDEVTVIGDAAIGGSMAAMHFSLDPGGTRLMAAIARAGGPKYPAFETLLTVQRNGRAELAMLSEIAANPMQNIQLQPGDAIYIGYKPKYFVAFGATGQSTTLAQLNRRFAFTDPSLTLADALALAGGLEDDRANPTGVFLYRQESQATLRSFGLQIPSGLPAMVPTIYLVSLSDPTGYFLTSLVPVHSEDLLYVSNAPAADLQKFLNLIGTVTGSASNIGSAGRY